MSHPARGHARRVGIDGKAKGAGRRRGMPMFADDVEDAAA